MAGASGRLAFLGRLLYPPKCAACGVLLPWRAPHEKVSHTAPDSILCISCAHAWESAEGEECENCASSVRECLCMPPLLKDARVHALFKLVYYVPRTRTETANRVIYRIKNRDDGCIFRFLAYRLSVGIAEGLRTAGIPWEDCVLTYLPRSARAKRKFGLDQSERLAREISHTLEIPMLRLIARRPFSNRKQKALSPEERKKNAERSFVPVRNVSCVGKTVLLADDIVTTGAGLAACSRLLYAMGAKRVLAVCVATDEINRGASVMGRIRKNRWDEKIFSKT